MTLGHSVDALIGAARGGKKLRMGLVQLDDGGVFRSDFEKTERFFALSEASRIIVRPEAADAEREVAAMMGVTGGLAEAAQCCWEDLCLLQPIGPDGQYVLTAGAVAFPTDWRLADKIGLPLTAIHAPIHGYAEQLAAGVDHFFGALKPGPVWGRANWFVVANDDWCYCPTDDPATRFAHVTAENAGATLFVRCERQTIRRLPESSAILFTIGIAVARLDTLSAASIARIADSVATVPAGEAERRGAPHYADALSAWAASPERLRTMP